MNLVTAELVIPPLVTSNHRTIFSAAYAGGDMAKIIDEHPKLSQLSEPVPELLIIMELTSCIKEPVLDVFPSKLAHDPIFARTHVHLDAVKFTEQLVVLFGPVGSDSLFLWTL
jgi:hypothetical protein